MTALISLERIHGQHYHSLSSYLSQKRINVISDVYKNTALHYEWYLLWININKSLFKFRVWDVRKRYWIDLKIRKFFLDFFYKIKVLKYSMINERKINQFGMKLLLREPSIDPLTKTAKTRPGVDRDKSNAWYWVTN